MDAGIKAGMMEVTKMLGGDMEARSRFFDQYCESENIAISDRIGIHSGQDAHLPKYQDFVMGPQGKGKGKGDGPTKKEIINRANGVLGDLKAKKNLTGTVLYSLKILVVLLVTCRESRMFIFYAF